MVISQSLLKTAERCNVGNRILRNETIPFMKEANISGRTSPAS